MHSSVVYLIEDSDDEVPPPKRHRKEPDSQQSQPRKEAAHVDVDLTEEIPKPIARPAFSSLPRPTNHLLGSPLNVGLLQPSSRVPRWFDPPFSTRIPFNRDAETNRHPFFSSISIGHRLNSSDRPAGHDHRPSQQNKSQEPRGSGPLQAHSSPARPHTPHSSPAKEPQLPRPSSETINQVPSIQRDSTVTDATRRDNLYSCSNCRNRGCVCEHFANKHSSCLQCYRRGELCDYPTLSSPTIPRRWSPNSNHSPETHLSLQTRLNHTLLSHTSRLLLYGLSNKSSPTPSQTARPTQEKVRAVHAQEPVPELDSGAAQEKLEHEITHTQRDNGVSETTEVTISPKMPPAQIEYDVDMEGITMVVNKLQESQRTWREKFVESELRQAAIDMRSRRLPNPGRKTPDPFKLQSSQSFESIVNNEKTQSKKSSGPVSLAVATRFKTPGPVLPRYKAIGRVNGNFLAPNRRTQKWRPYEPDDELEGVDVDQKYMELPHRYAADYPSRERQVRCQEAIKRWQPWADRLLEILGLQKSDVLHFFAQKSGHSDDFKVYLASLPLSASSALQAEVDRQCTTCGIADMLNEENIESGLHSMEHTKPTPQTIALAGLAAHAFHNMTNISLWHLAIGGYLLPPSDPLDREEDVDACHVCNTDTRPSRDGVEPCAICFCHRCPHHGTFHDPFNFDEESRYREHDVKVIVDDDESQYNVRHFVSLPGRPFDDHTQNSHLCGIFCVDAKQSLRSVLGLQSDGTVAGACRELEQARAAFNDDELCSDACFWKISNRPNTDIYETPLAPGVPKSAVDLINKMIPFYLASKRGPCSISRMIRDVSCEAVFEHMLHQMQQVPHQDESTASDVDGDNTAQVQDQLRKRKGPVMDVSRSMELDKRPSFTPCSHHGPCTKENNCSCALNRVHCERSCGCPEACTRRFKGCTCVAKGNKVCFKDQRCECWKLNRECDPDICRKCGVVEVLDSSNKYKEEFRIGRCRNNRIQLGVPAATTKAPSQIQGYGLYSRAYIAAGDFIGEYVGEVLTQAEGNRRGAMYHVLNQEYLFMTNREQEVDASNNGNKMRFMNNSLLDANINVEPRKLLCSGVVRVGLFARRAIKAGEELLYNYSYPEEVTRTFWEPGERDAHARRLIPMSSHRIARTTGTNNMAGVTNGGPKPALQKKSKKRKRRVIESPVSDVDMESAQSAEDFTESEATMLPEIGDSEESEYGINGLASEDEETDGLMDVAVNPKVRWKVAQSRPRAGVASGIHAGHHPKSKAPHRRVLSDSPVRQRSINPGDKRLGGRAQQKAWRTRKQREAMREAAQR
ncbi:hypothetical protein PV10_02225 [Exophiala mesophila]|uniref:SET domain-containing protein n=1 Tax=Exophiala mesophila TaxID=212818 RepID=A0A0D1ZKN7_EXOME|nr:uncharacterized protein PV10_02225 [Exophiala mesophila]KIV94459.1 hypothetical protein PV10_02225 [Exophiala mesophila]